MLGDKYFRFFLAAIVVFACCASGAFLVARALSIPPGFVASFGINERLRFLKEAPHRGPVIAVIGASVAANNIDSDLMEKVEGRPFLNFGAYGLALQDQVPFYNLIRRAQPVDGVIFVSQYYEYRDRKPGITVPEDTLARYVTGRMSPFEIASYYQLSAFDHYLTRGAELRGRQNAASVAYTPSGAIPLEMDVRVSDPDHMTASVLSTTPCETCLGSLEQLCRSVAADGLRLSVVLPPVQLNAIAGIERHRLMREDRRARIKATVARCGGEVFDAGDFAPFDDSCFADYSHLNAKGMKRFTDMLIAYRNSAFVPPTEPIDCAR